MSKDKPLVTVEEILFSNMLEIQALIKILERKGLVTQDEILTEVELLKKEIEEKIRRMGREDQGYYLYIIFCSGSYGLLTFTY